MLASITVENFKSYKQATLPLAPLTLMIGANASGKSNIIEAIRLLSWLADGHKLGTMQYEIQSLDLLVRGNASDFAKHGEVSFKISCDFIEHIANIEITIGVSDNALEITGERLMQTGRSVPLYETKELAAPGSSDIRVAYDNYARGGHKPQIICSNQQAIFTQLQTPARFGKTHSKAQKTIPELTKLIQSFFSAIVLLDPEPRAMRDYVHKADTQPSGDGRNMSAMLHALWQDASNREGILNFIRSLPEQNIAKLDFIETPRDEVMVQLVETFGEREVAVDAPLLSDGTLRILSVVAALMSAAKGSLVVIEEIDNGVHPSRANQLMSNIKAIADERDLRVLLTTHNPALMDALPTAALAHVVFCYRDPKNGESRLVRLSDLADYPELMAQGDLGDLVTSGTVDRFVKHHPGPEEKKRQALDWLESLKATDAA